MSAPAPAPLDGVLAIVVSIQDRVAEAENQVDQIVRNAEQFLDQLPGWVVGDTRTALADLQRVAAETIAQIRAWLATSGDPIALELAATGWIEEVAGPVSALVPLGAAERPELTSSWSGDAAEAYVAVLPAQGMALQAIQDTAGDVRMALTEFANAIRAFWSGIDNAVITAAVGLDAAVGAAATGVGAIFGVVLALGAIGACSTSIGQEIAAFGSLTAATTSQSGALVTRLHDNAGFGTTVWPRSTTDLFADGSITDGDPTDWHVG
jgi:hypothetical protein